VKQKLFTTQRAGLTEVHLPQRNEPDLNEFPADVLAALTVHIVSDVREILSTALAPVSTGAVAVA
jgi:ATP-dependent Lon protease